MYKLKKFKSNIALFCVLNDYTFKFFKKFILSLEKQSEKNFTLFIYNDSKKKGIEKVSYNLINKPIVFSNKTIKI